MVFRCTSSSFCRIGTLRCSELQFCVLCLLLLIRPVLDAVLGCCCCCRHNLSWFGESCHVCGSVVAALRSGAASKCGSGGVLHVAALMIAGVDFGDSVCAVLGSAGQCQ